MAKVLGDDPATHAEADPLARRARKGFAAYDGTFDEDLREIDAWWAQRVQGR